MLHGFDHKLITTILAISGMATWTAGDLPYISWLATAYSVIWYRPTYNIELLEYALTTLSCTKHHTFNIPSPVKLKQVIKGTKIIEFLKAQ